MSRWSEDEFQLRRPVLVKVEPPGADRNRLREFFEKCERLGVDPSPMPAFDVRNADHIACLLSEHLRVENGRVEGIGYVAVQIAEAVARSLKKGSE